MGLAGFRFCRVRGFAGSRVRGSAGSRFPAPCGRAAVRACGGRGVPRSVPVGGSGLAGFRCGCIVKIVNAVCVVFCNEFKQTHARM